MCYDIENRLTTASGSHNATLVYDPLGRLYEIDGSSGTTKLIYDGDALVEETDASANILRRYIHGGDLGDDPVAWYEGAAFADSNERLLRADHEGSIIVVADHTTSTIYGVNTYDEYGVPGSANIGRFQYTGQIWIPELGLYHYKARAYSPTFGRFMQSDPVGYTSDDLNLYTYGGNDPLNRIDPLGLRNCDPKDTSCVETPDSAQTPGDPNQKSSETQQMEQLVVRAQKTRKDSDGQSIPFNDGEEHAQYVTPDGIHRAKLTPKTVVPCPGRKEVVVNVASIPPGTTPSHTHPSLYGPSGSVPGPGDDRGARSSASHSAFVMTASNAFTIEAMSNGTFRTTVASGKLSDAQRADLVSSMQNWENEASHAPGANMKQQMCAK